jgi:UDP-N-acetylglucosamine 2-epimerase (non-hydrolysing)
MLKIVNVVGARPNFMKVAPIHRRMMRDPHITPLLLHTGQHYDEKMSKTFFVELGMPEPDVYLGVGSGSHAQQTAAVMVALERYLLESRPDWILVVGDVNSTLAASLVAAKLHIPVAHVEAGLRSYDREMPEEINRILTDAISDILFITEQSGWDNLLKEGVSEKKMRMVGNVMIDSLVEHLDKARTCSIATELGVTPHAYGLMTLHRPSNVDNPEILKKILDAVAVIQKEMPVIFPIHPRTRKMLSQFGLDEAVTAMTNLTLTDPLGYLAFLKLMSEAKFVLTDSGGVQEETTFLDIPCLTLRENTERPITTTLGSNRLVPLETEAILSFAQQALQGRLQRKAVPPLWDGETSKRIVDIFKSLS